MVCVAYRPRHLGCDPWSSLSSNKVRVLTYTPTIHATISDPWYGTSGPRDARIVLVGESWGAAEADQKLPFVGESGKELTRILADAGISRNQVFFTNCFAAQPPGNEVWRFFNSKGEALWRGLSPTPWARSELNRLYHQLREIGPTVVIAAGNYALWALTGEAHVSFSSESTGDGATVIVPSGIMSWRGSMLESSIPEIERSLKLLPILHPAAILRAWYQRAVTVHDLSSRIPLAL